MNNVKAIQKLNETELRLGVGSKKSWHDVYAGSAYVFIGGLDYGLTEGDVLSVFSQYGEIVNINLVKDKKTGNSKGFCFLAYEDQRSTVLAVDNLNGIKVCGRTVRVDHVRDYRRPKDENGDEIIEKGCAPRTPTPSPTPSPSPPPAITSAEKAKKKKKKLKKEKKEKKVKKKKKRIDSDSSYSSDEDFRGRQKSRMKEERSRLSEEERVSPVRGRPSAKQTSNWRRHSRSRSRERRPGRASRSRSRSHERRGPHHQPHRRSLSRERTRQHSRFHHHDSRTRSRSRERTKYK